jgi:hypothetical protein
MCDALLVDQNPLQSKRVFKHRTAACCLYRAYSNALRHYSMAKQYVCLFMFELLFLELHARVKRQMPKAVVRRLGHPSQVVH